MRSLLLLCSIGLTCSLCAQTNQPKQLIISFNTGEYIPDSIGLMKLQQFTSYLDAKQQEIDSVYIYGFADSVGSNQSNQLLSGKRTAYMQTFFQQTFAVEDTRIHQQFYGEEAGTTASLPWQQRAVFVHVWLHPVTQAAPAWKGSSAIFASLESLGPDWQSFTIMPNADATIKGKNGTLIYIPANSFDLPAYLKDKPIKISLREYYDYSELFFGGMTTMSDNQALETSGSIDLQASSGGTPVTLLPNARVNVNFAMQVDGNGFQLFFGSRSNRGTINWIQQDAVMTSTAVNKRFKMKSMYAFTKSDTVSCPYFTCGLSSDIQWLLHYSSRMRRKTYGNIDWCAYRAYLDSLCVQFNAVGYNDLVLKVKSYNNNLVQTSRYSVQSKNFGYLNCDRFIELPEDKKTDIFVLGKQDSTAICLAFAHDYNALLATNFSDTDKIGFRGVGREGTYTVVMIKYDGHNYFIYKETIKTDESVTLSPTFKKVDKKNLQQILSSINGIQPT